jgi:hypothetical protein
VVRDDFNHEDMALRLRQLDLREIYNPKIGYFNFGETADQLRAALQV